jgi:hypothetical protein
MAQRYMPEISRRRQAHPDHRRRRSCPTAWRASRRPARRAAISRPAASGVAHAADRRATAKSPKHWPDPVAARGLLLVGLDVIGDRLTEINVTSPTCMVEITATDRVSTSPRCSSTPWSGMRRFPPDSSPGSAGLCLACGLQPPPAPAGILCVRHPRRSPHRRGARTAGPRRQPRRMRNSTACTGPITPGSPPNSATSTPPSPPARHHPVTPEMAAHAHRRTGHRRRRRRAVRPRHRPLIALWGFPVRRIQGRLARPDALAGAGARPTAHGRPAISGNGRVSSRNRAGGQLDLGGYAKGVRARPRRRHPAWARASQRPDQHRRQRHGARHATASPGASASSTRANRGRWRPGAARRRGDRHLRRLPTLFRAGTASVTATCSTRARGNRYLTRKP